MSKGKGKKGGNGKKKGIAIVGIMAMLWATITGNLVILAIQITATTEYIINAIIDPEHRAVWLMGAGIVAILIGWIEIKNKR